MGENPDEVVMPADFLPQAERFGLIGQIDRYMVHRRSVSWRCNRLWPKGWRNEQTLQLLRKFGVDYARGFHLGRPRPDEAIGS